MTAAHRDDEALARRAEVLLNALDPSVTPAQDPADLRSIGLALRAIESANAELDEAVTAARAAGRSWTEIAGVLGVSRQAARQRFVDRVPA